MPHVLDLQNLATHHGWDHPDGGEGVTSCSNTHCSIYQMDGFAE